MALDISFRNADERDAGALAALFSATFRETFGHLYKSADLVAFLAQHSAEHWAEQLRESKFAVRIAEDVGGALGFAKLGPVKLPVDEPGTALELRQLYVVQRVRGSGVAANLLNWLIGEAGARGAQNLYLSVYSENLRAQRFYARHGFVEIGPCVFKVGSQADKDIIMKRALT